MKSWEVLREATERIGVKAVAARLKLSTALVYKWCQEPPTNEDPQSSGARNPLDRLLQIMQATGDPRVVNWLCNQSGGFFCPNIDRQVSSPEEELLSTTHKVVQKFSDLLTKISRSVEDDGQISADEADIIRQSWERLKMHGEAFVVACEHGMYMLRDGLEDEENSGAH
ncbi:MAG: phage regulatory CII family protein [Planctomycetota bacterium]